MKRVILAISVLLSWTSTLFAQSLPDMLIPSDPAAVSLGGMVGGNAAFSADNNVSALVFAPRTVNVGISALNWAPNATSIGSANAGVGLRFGRVGVAIAAKGNALQPYTTYNESWQPSGEFRPLNVFGSAGVAFLVAERLSVGLTGRFCSSSIAPACSATAFASDLSATWQGRIFRASLAVCNLGTPVRYSQEGAAGRLPGMVRASVDVHLLDCLTVGGEADCLLNDGSLMFTAGAQYSLKDILFVRAGYHYGNSSAVIPQYVSLGAAVSLFGVELGASWITASEVLGNSMVFSLTAAF